MEAGEARYTQSTALEKTHFILSECPPDNLKHNQPPHESQSVLPLILFGSDSSKMNMTVMSTNLFCNSFFKTVNLKSKWQLLKHAQLFKIQMAAVV